MRPRGFACRGGGARWGRGGCGVRVGGGHTTRPPTRALGSIARALVRRLPHVVHVPFHDYELLETRRAAALRAVLAVLARRRRPTELGRLAGEREVAWEDVCAV